MTARVIRPAFGGATAPLPPADEPFDAELTGPPPAPPRKDDSHGGGGGGGPGGGEDDGDAGEPVDFGQVTPMGFTTRRGATAYVFLDASGNQTTLSARDLYQRACLKSLFGGSQATSFLIENWPAPTRGKRKVADDYDAEALGDALMTACSLAGHADGVELRRDGIWRWEDTLIFHAGDRILLPGTGQRWNEERDAGWRDGSAIYVNTPERRDPPAAVAATKMEVADLQEALRMWNFAAPGAPQVLIGLVACGLLGAALSWRPHVFLRGPRGSGKSSLARLIAAACGAGEPSDNITAAGLRREFDARSGLIPLDEREADAEGAERVMGIMRGSSDGKGSVTVQASPDGGGTQTFRVAGCFLFAAITMPAMTEADASRITVVQLRKTEVDRRAEVEEQTEIAAALHPKLLARMLHGWGRWQINWRVARAAAGRRDSTSRSADQVGALLAGWWTLARDVPMTDAIADREIKPFAEFLTTRAEEEASDEANQVLQHLLGSRVPITQRGSDQMTIQAALIAALREQVPLSWTGPMASEEVREQHRARAEMWDKRLGAVGLRVLLDPMKLKGWPFEIDRSPGLLIGQSHPQVKHAFNSSTWPGTAWRGPLQDLPGVHASKGVFKFPHGGAHRAIFVPLGLLGIDDDELVAPAPVDPMD